MSIWKHNLSVYNNDYSLDQKIFGIGLGKEGQPWYLGKKGPYVRSSHGDYLSLFMGLGPIGLVLYLFLYLVLMYDIFYSPVDIKLKIIFSGILVSVVVMNVVSNSYIVRVELAQYFWLFMGIFYALNDNIKRSWQEHG
jgi:O-antigen ligase